MSQVNNNAESLSRELRKFKNLKSVDYKGLLAGTPESYVNLFRYLFCENNIAFSQSVLDKGYDLAGLNDYKFMEAVYRMMRDFLNIKPPINQNQFFSPSFTQRKLEMSTIIAAQVRKMTNELANKNGKKSVQTPSLMKSSLKRSNSAPRHARVIEMGSEESENHKNKILPPFQKHKKTNSTDKYNGKKVTEMSHKIKSYTDNSGSSDELSEGSEAADSYKSQSRTNDRYIGNNYDSRLKPFVERTDMAGDYNSQDVTRNNYDNRPRPFLETAKYSSTSNYHKSLDTGDISAFETTSCDNEKYNKYHSRNLNHHNNHHNQKDRIYDVKHYVPISTVESHESEKNQNVSGLEKIMQQFETVLARITLLEGRMQRIEANFENNNNMTQDRYQTPVSYPNQGSNINSNYTTSFDYNFGNKSNSYSSSNNNVLKGTKESIPDFESNQQPLRSKLDSDRSYSSSTYSNNYKSHAPNDYNYTAPKYVTNFTNYSDKRSQDLQGSNNSLRDNYIAPSVTYNSCQPQGGHSKVNTVTPIELYQPPGSHTHKAAPSLLKASNGIPPLYPTATKKPEDSGSYKDSRYMKHSEDKVLSQTDRIASMLSDTQKMLRLSDEEL